MSILLQGGDRGGFASAELTRIDKPTLTFGEEETLEWDRYGWNEMPG